MRKKIQDIQKRLAEQETDGWLLFDNHGSNRFIRDILEIPAHLVLTRRFFYWIPQVGDPELIIHQIESESLNHLPGKRHLYLSWGELDRSLKNVLNNKKKVLMEYSPLGANPFVSVVDGGTLEMVREAGVEAVSSADVLQSFTSVLSEEQIASHYEAALIVQTAVSRAWDYIADRIKKKQQVTEYDVQKFILTEFKTHKCITEEGPCCSVNEHSALPHYIATRHNSTIIKPGDFVLIDLWCKKNIPNAVYADITRVAVLASQPSPKQLKIFNIVKMAQKKAFDFVRTRMDQGIEITGAEVDDVCRESIKSSGYGEYFTHRTGHNIDTHVHGAGVHFDNLEISDHRRLLPGMCFSIEPGIYLAGEFGVRLESNLLIRHNRVVDVTGGIEETMICLG